VSSDTRDHSSHVNNWVGTAAKGLSSGELLQLSEMAMAALWFRAYLTLGELTVVAITDRVLAASAENFPPFQALKASPKGIDWRELHNQCEGLTERELTAGVHFLISEFIGVVGNLTAEILKPALQAELLKVRLERPASGGMQGEKQS